MENKYEKFKELLTTEATAMELLALSAEDASVVLEEKYDISFSVNELNEILLGMRAGIAEAEKEELSEVDLDQVAGGGSSNYNYGKSVGRAVTAVGIVVCVVGIAACGW